MGKGMNMHDQRIAALTMATRALIQANDGHVYSVAQLANIVTKASKFVFELKNRYMERDERNGLLEIEAEVLLKLCSEYVKPQYGETDRMYEEEKAAAVKKTKEYDKMVGIKRPPNYFNDVTDDNA